MGKLNLKFRYGAKKEPKNKRPVKVAQWRMKQLKFCNLVKERILKINGIHMKIVNQIRIIKTNE